MVKFIDNRSRRPGTAGRRGRSTSSIDVPYWQCQDGRVVYHDSHGDDRGEQLPHRTTVTPGDPTKSSLGQSATNTTHDNDPDTWQNQIVQSGISVSSPMAAKASKGVPTSSGCNELVPFPPQEQTNLHHDQITDCSVVIHESMSEPMEELKLVKAKLISLETELKEKSEALDKFQRNQLEFEALLQKVKDENKDLLLKLEASRLSLNEAQAKVGELENQAKKAKRQLEGACRETDRKLASQASKIKSLHENLQLAEKERSEWLDKYKAEKDARVAQEQRFAGLSLLLEETKREQDQKDTRWKMMMTQLDKGQGNWDSRSGSIKSPSVSTGRSSRVEFVESHEFKVNRGRKRTRSALVRESRTSLRSRSPTPTVGCHSRTTANSRSRSRSSTVPTYMGKPLIKLERLLRRPPRTLSAKRRLVLEDSPAGRTIEDEI